MSNNVIRKFYAGGNTCYGFYSLYDNIISQSEAARIFTIKGGPGVGKSIFMKDLGQKFFNKGFDIEYHCCSSDNNSIDGLVVPALKVCLVDGTAPHIIDPKHPGAIDEIINLGDYWNEKIIIEKREEIISTTKMNSQAFKTAYFSLKQAKVAYDEWLSYITQSTNYVKVNEITANLLNEIFSGVKPDYNSKPKSRELFASATTPGGLVNEWPSILSNCKKAFWLQGEPGTGKSTLIRKVIENAHILGLDTEIFRCSFDPSKYSGVFIPDLQIAVVSPFPNDYKMDNFNGEVKTIDFNHYLMEDRLSSFKEELVEAKSSFWNCINRAVKYIAKAKKIHDKLENYYVPAMNFDAINQKKDEVLDKILNLKNQI